MRWGRKLSNLLVPVCLFSFANLSRSLQNCRVEPASFCDGLPSCLGRLHSTSPMLTMRVVNILVMSLHMLTIVHVFTSLQAISFLYWLNLGRFLLGCEKAHLRPCLYQFYKSYFKPITFCCSSFKDRVSRHWGVCRSAEILSSSTSPCKSLSFPYWSYWAFLLLNLLPLHRDCQPFERNGSA